MRYHPFSFGQEKNMVLFLFLGPSSRPFLASSVPRRFFFFWGLPPILRDPFSFPKNFPKTDASQSKKTWCQNQSQCALGYFSQQPSLIRTLGVVVWVVLFTSWKMCCLACVFRRVGTKKSGMTHAA